MKCQYIAEGGSVKGIALVGAYKALVERDFTISHAAGTSAGAITASLIAAGYTPDELYDLMMETNFNDFLDGPSWVVKQALAVFRNRGIYKGEKFYEWISDALAEKGIYTFNDLIDPDAEDERLKFKLKVIASDLTRGKMVVLPDDLHEYGINPGGFQVAKAVHMSMSIPLFFQPTYLPSPYREVKPGGFIDMEILRRRNTIVDGGLLSNYPIWIWDSLDVPRWPTFGLTLKESDADIPQNTGSLAEFLKAIVRTVVIANDLKRMDPEDELHRTISLPVGDVGMMDFNLSASAKQKLHQSGYESTLEFLDNWSWIKYRNWAVKKRGLK